MPGDAWIVARSSAAPPHAVPVMIATSRQHPPQDENDAEELARGKQPSKIVDCRINDASYSAIANHDEAKEHVHVKEHVHGGFKSLRVSSTTHEAIASKRDQLQVGVGMPGERHDNQFSRRRPLRELQKFAFGAHVRKREWDTEASVLQEALDGWKVNFERQRRHR